MKKLELFFIVVLANLGGVVLAHGQSGSQAFKFDEGPVQGGCGEYSRITSFTDEMMANQQNSRGLVIVFRGDGNDRFGNLLAYVEGARGFVAKRGVPTSKVSYVIAEGKSFAYEEYWIIPDGADLPPFVQARTGWNLPTSKYLFSQTCTSCEPSYPELGLSLPHYEGFAAALRENAGHRGRIEVNNYEELVAVQNELTATRRIDRRRYSIVIKKERKDRDALTNELYIIPGTN